MLELCLPEDNPAVQQYMWDFPGQQALEGHHKMMRMLFMETFFWSSTHTWIEGSGDLMNVWIAMLTWKWV